MQDAKCKCMCKTGWILHKWHGLYSQIIMHKAWSIHQSYSTSFLFQRRQFRLNCVKKQYFENCLENCCIIYQKLSFTSLTPHECFNIPVSISIVWSRSQINFALNKYHPSQLGLFCWIINNNSHIVILHSDPPVCLNYLINL